MNGASLIAFTSQKGAKDVRHRRDDRVDLRIFTFDKTVKVDLASGQ